MSLSIFAVVPISKAQVYLEIWTNITAGTVASLTNAAAFASNANIIADNASFSDSSGFEISTNTIDSYCPTNTNFGMRMRTFLVPPLTGYYVFMVSCDDQCQVYLSSNDQPSRKRTIAMNYAASGNNYLKTNLEPWQMSAPLYLLAGGRYYLEVLYKQGTGARFFDLGWQMPDGTSEIPMSTANLAPFSPVAAGSASASDPSYVDGVENNSAVFSVSVFSPDTLVYQWQKWDSIQLEWGNVPNAENAAFETPPLTPGNINDLYRCKVQNGMGTYDTYEAGFSSIAPDTTKPTVTEAVGYYANQVQVFFSEAVTLATATNKTNYTLTGSSTPGISNATLSANGRTAMLTLSNNMVVGGTYTVRANNLRDVSSQANLIDAATNVATFTYSTFVAGLLQQQLYTLNTNSGSIWFMWTNSRYLNLQADIVNYPIRGTWPAEGIMDGYGGRLAGWLVPPVSGAYNFSIASDDNGIFFISSNGQPTNRYWLDYQPGSGATYDAHPSAPITLEAGKRYFIEAIMKEGTGGDYLRLAWKTPYNQTWDILPTYSLGYYTNINIANSIVTITRQPTNCVVPQYQRTVVSLVATGFCSLAPTNVLANSPVTYQWQLNGVDIPGAISNWVATPLLYETNLTYTAIVRCGGKSLLSSAAVISTQPDLIPPTLLRAVNLSLTNVAVTFSETVRPLTATNIANYKFTNGLSVLRATNSIDPRTIILTTTPFSVGSTNTIFVSGVTDLATNNNTITSNSPATFIARNDYYLWDIGTPSVSGSIVSSGTGYDITGVGSDIVGTADQMQFCYQLKTGNFDIQTRVASVAPGDLFAKGGLMARETLDSGSRYGGVFASPSLHGCLFQSRTNLGGTNYMAGNEPVNPGNTWLRLQRTNSILSGYASYDGLRWSLLGSVTITNLANTIYFGFAVSSHSSSNTTLTQFRDVSTTTSTLTVPSLAKDREPLGPTTRRTAIAITEIMCKPAKRTDSNNTEFVEIFNSNPTFDDLSGWRLSGDIDYTFPPGTIIGGGEFLVVAASPAGVQAVYGLANVLGPYTNSLKTAGLLRLRNEWDAIQQEINYNDKWPWPVGADGSGHSLVLARASYGEDNPRAWALSAQLGGSPGQADPLFLSTNYTVVINELLVHTDPPQVDYIELYNHSTQAVNLSGWTLSDAADTNKYIIPTSTIIGPRSFAIFYENTLGFALSTLGEKVYLRSGTNGPIVDAIDFPPQNNGMSYGRWPDGANDWYTLKNLTEGTNNAAPWVGPVAINELMYDPISTLADDQYVELYNWSPTNVNISGWRFTDGISYHFPSNTILAAGGYVVVAKNYTNLLAKYPQLNSGNTFGNFSGTLAGSGERVQLSMPYDTITTNKYGVASTNTIYIEMDSVRYRKGGRWGAWASGGGSSLELIDPRSNHRLAANWADSDESPKTSNLWTTVNFRGYLDYGATQGNSNIWRLDAYLCGAGECLLDNVEIVHDIWNTNMIASTNWNFESGLGGWKISGTHIKSSLEVGGGFGGGNALHVRASDRGDTLVNSIRVPISLGLSNGQIATIRAKVRWLKGFPEIIIRTEGNYLEALTRMQLPNNLGTPGQANSQARANNAPAIYDVQHYPILPPAGQPVVVSARISDPDGLSGTTLKYRLDPSTNLTSVTMKDDGTGGDAVANDGIYSGTIPGQTNGTMVAFYIESADNYFVPATARFPSDAPNRDCLVRFGEIPSPGSYGIYRHWMSSTNVNRWYNRYSQSNEKLDATFVYGDCRVVYNAMGCYAGSPSHQVLTSTNSTRTGWPDTANAEYSWAVPTDDMVLGTDNFSKLHMPGNTPGQDETLQREQTALWIARKMGLPAMARRFVVAYFNGYRKGALMEDTQVPGGEMVDQWFSTHNKGDLYKINRWFECHNMDTVSNATVAIGFNTIWGQIDPFRTTNLNVVPNVPVLKAGRYRNAWLVRSPNGTANSFDPLFEMVETATATNTVGYVSNLSSIVSLENWMRTFAVEHATGNWDSFGHRNSQNMYAYKPYDGKWHLMMWDCNIVLGNPYSIPDPPDGSQLWQIGTPPANGSGFNMVAIYNTPAFRRMYLRAFKDLANGPMATGGIDQFMDAHYTAFAVHGFTNSNPDAIRSYVSTMRDSLLTAVLNDGAEGFPLAVDGPTTFDSSSNYVALTGTAPIEAKTILINGREYPISWLTTTSWSINVPLMLAGTNALVVQALDSNGHALTNASTTNYVNFTSVVPPPQGNVIITELSFKPAVPDAEFIELFNASTNFTYDLSQWRINGLSYTFPDGAALAPQQYLVLAKNLTAYTNYYGATSPVYGSYSGNLQSEGETITLFRPVGTNEEAVARVTYETTAPWPVVATNQPETLQLVDTSRDIARIANWALGGWKYFSATVSNSTAVDRVDALKFYLGASGSVLLDQVRMVKGSVSTVGSNLLRNGGFEMPMSNGWAAIGVASGSSISNAAGLRGNALWLKQTASGDINNCLAQSNLTIKAYTAYTVSYWYLPLSTNLNLLTYLNNNMIFANGIGSPAAASTPGATNNVMNSLPFLPPVWLNELQPENIAGPLDNFSEREPWIELFNSGSNTVDLTGWYLANSFTNIEQWAFPTGTVIAPKQFMVIWADGQPQQTTGTNLHTSFRLTAGAGTVTLVMPETNSSSFVLDYLTYSNLASGYSFGNYPDGQPARRMDFFTATPGQSNSAMLGVFINEFMADNTNTIRNPITGAYDDWFELYNPSTNTVDLEGYYLTDNLTNQTQYKIPAGYKVPGRGYLLVWADNTPGNNDTNHPALHVNFSLKKSGEALGLYASDGTRVDSLTFTSQTSDISQGRYPDGSAVFTNLFTIPTPGAANYIFSANTAPVLGALSNWVVNAGQNLAFTATATDAEAPPQILSFTLGSGTPSGATIASGGAFSWTPATNQIGTNYIMVVVMDNAIPPKGASNSFSVEVYLPFEFKPANLITTNGQVNFGFNAIPGKQYQVWYKDNLSASWLTLGAAQTATNAVLSIQDAMSTNKTRFYRIQKVN